MAIILRVASSGGMDPPLVNMERYFECFSLSWMTRKRRARSRKEPSGGRSIDFARRDLIIEPAWRRKETAFGLIEVEGK